MIRVTIPKRVSARAALPESKPVNEIRLVDAKAALACVRQGETIRAKTTDPGGLEVTLRICGSWSTSAFMTRIWAWAFAKTGTTIGVRFYIEKEGSHERNV